MSRVAGKVALVTGAGKGIGRACADLLAREGAQVALADIVAESTVLAADVIEQAGGQALALALDVTDEPAWQHAIAHTVDRFGGLDILVNNAGIAGPENVETTDLALWHKIMGVNLTGTFLGMKHAIPVMRTRGGGSIINMNSTYGLTGGDGSAAYCASKGGIATLTKSAALHCGKQGTKIRVNGVCPGAILTDLLFRAADRYPDGREAGLAAMAGAHPLGRNGTPEDIANGVLYLASDESSFVTGTHLVIDGGILAD